MTLYNLQGELSYGHKLILELNGMMEHWNLLNCLDNSHTKTIRGLGQHLSVVTTTCLFSFSPAKPKMIHFVSFGLSWKNHVVFHKSHDIWWC